MFRHILLSTDGSAQSVAAADKVLQFARDIGAQVTVVHVVLPVNLIAYEPGAIEAGQDACRKDRERCLREYLAPIEQRAQEYKVKCTALQVEAEQPYEAILSTAHDRMCDLIAMASHGRKGLGALILGSQTQKVLTHSAIPVMVLK